MSGLFFTSWQGYNRTGDENFSHSRQYKDEVTQTMLEGERLEQKKTTGATESKAPEAYTPDEKEAPVNPQNCL